MDLVNEANFRSRLRYYLEQEMPEWMLEYRVEEEIRKKLKEHGIRWIPDIIIHKPSRIYGLPVTEGNLGVIELKLSTSEKQTVHVIRKLKDYRQALNYVVGFLICSQSKSKYVIQIENLRDQMAGDWKDGYLNEIAYDTKEAWLIHAWYTEEGRLRKQQYERKP